MKSCLLLVPALLATTIAFADTQPAASSPPADAQAKAAALLAPRHVLRASNVDGQGRSSSSRAGAPDAQASAAALLSGVRSAEGSVPSEIARPTAAHASKDAHAHAAALLSRDFVSPDARRAAQHKDGDAGISASSAHGVGTDRGSK